MLVFYSSSVFLNGISGDYSKIRTEHPVAIQRKGTSQRSVNIVHHSDTNVLINYMSDQGEIEHEG